MKSDFEGLKDLLQADVSKFLDDMKDTLIPMLDLGLDAKLKADLIRSVHGLKAVGGMFELHNITDFIADVEAVIGKIFDLGRPDISNDLLNDMFEIKDQIEKLFKDFLNGSQEGKVGECQTLCETRKKECKERLEEFNRHYVTYKMGKEVLEQKGVAPSIPAPQSLGTPPSQPLAPTVSVSAPSSEEKKVLYVHDDVMYFSPLSLKHEDTVHYQSQFVSSLDNVKQINVDLGQTNRLDIAGIGFIQSIQKHCKVSGVKFLLVAQSDLVKLEAGILGVEL